MADCPTAEGFSSYGEVDDGDSADISPGCAFGAGCGTALRVNWSAGRSRGAGGPCTSPMAAPVSYRGAHRKWPSATACGIRRASSVSWPHLIRGWRHRQRLRRVRLVVICGPPGHGNTFEAAGRRKCRIGGCTAQGVDPRR